MIIARAAQQPSAKRDQQHFQPEDAGETVEVECSPQRAAEDDVEQAQSEPSENQPRGDAGGFVENFHVHGPLPHQAAQHGGSSDAAERHESGRSQIQHRQPRCLPQRVHSLSGQQHQRAQRRLVHPGQQVRRRNDPGKK